MQSPVSLPCSSPQLCHNSQTSKVLFFFIVDDRVKLSDKFGTAAVGWVSFHISCVRYET